MRDLTQQLDAQGMTLDISQYIVDQLSYRVHQKKDKTSKQAPSSQAIQAS